MATKTFKIGLSNTDKQNMAQDIYERLLALTFPEYDSAESYDVGDFVVYNDQLYKCIGATSGAWDSSKWQLATLNDLLTDIEDAVQFVNDKANVDGNYPTMTVGVADQLSPYDDESGDDQDEPFGFQATGTGNGSQPDFSTGSIALMKEKRGNTVVVNQKVVYPLLNNSQDWYTSNFSSSDFQSDGFSGEIVNDGTDAKLIHYFKIHTNHKYLFISTLKSSSAITNYTEFFDGNIENRNPHNLTTSYQTFFDLFASTRENDIGQFQVVRASTTESGITVYVKEAYIIDLTQWFNGDIPQDLLDHPEHFFRYYQGSLAYNTGELVNANSRYLKAIGRNQWDEEWEVSGLVSGSGNSKNFIKVIPNAAYYFYCGDASYNNGEVYLYDKDGNYINKIDVYSGLTFTTPSNCCFIKFRMSGNYGTTYNNDITISIYYEDESGYDQYYPYELLTNNDTGTETLLAFDYKTPDGVVHKNTGVVDLTSATVNTISAGQFYLSGISQTFSNLVKKSGNNIPFKAKISLGYKTVSYNTSWTNDAMFIDTNGILHIKDDTCADATAMSAKLNGAIMQFELAEPTTEQGTPYSENIVIDDFGSMEFSGTSGVPQGNLIFYPVDYKAFIDTLYDYTEGTPSNIALKSDLSSSWVEQTDLSSKITDVAGLTYVIKKAYKTGNLVSLSIRATNSTGNSIAANETLFKLTGDLKPTFSGYTVAIVGCVGDNVARFQIDHSSGDVSCVSTITNNTGIHLYVTFAVA